MELRQGGFVGARVKAAALAVTLSPWRIVGSFRRGPSGITLRQATTTSGRGIGAVWRRGRVTATQRFGLVGPVSTITTRRGAGA